MCRRAILVIAVLSAGCLCLFAVSAEIRSVGLRLILPFSGTPVLPGADAVANASFGGLSISLFLSPAGGTLLLGSADIAWTDDPSEASTFLRLTTGLFSHFGSARRLPSILVGAGMSVRYVAAESLIFGFTGELISPLAFPVPMPTLPGAGSLR